LSLRLCAEEQLPPSQHDRLSVGGAGAINRKRRGHVPGDVRLARMPLWHTAAAAAEVGPPAEVATAAAKAAAEAAAAAAAAAAATVPPHWCEVPEDPASSPTRSKGFARLLR